MEGSIAIQHGHEAGEGTILDEKRHACENVSIREALVVPYRNDFQKYKKLAIITDSKKTIAEIGDGR